MYQRKKIKRNIVLLFILFILLFLLSAGFFRAGRSLTYIESVPMNTTADTSVAIDNSNIVLEQNFTMPVALFHGFDMKLGTFERNNNSFWNVILSDADNHPVYHWRFNSSQASDGEYYMLTAASPVAVQKGEQYQLRISSTDCTGNSALAFYMSENDSLKNGLLSVKGINQSGDLCFQIYGGEKDIFYQGFYLAFMLLSFLFLLYLYVAYKRGKDVTKLAGSLLTAVLFLVLMYIFSRENMGTFTDECDNIRGGMLIANGKVLYRDYYTQHTPFTYYLCALYALLGAGSIQQFRLLYYITCAFLWAFLYYRHSAYFGKIKMLLLPVLQIIIVTSMFFQGSKIMGDNIQGLCMIVLLLELIRYWEDHTLSTSRCIIAGVSVFIAVSSAFVSLFALAPIFLSVLLGEFIYWKKVNDFGIKKAFLRYWKLITASCLPFALTFFYFACTHALKPMILMAYKFNTTVYNQYQNQYGRVIWKPFFLGIKNYFTTISDHFASLITASGNTLNVIQLVIALSVGYTLITWAVKKQKLLPALAVFLCMCGNSTRSAVDFHGAAFWNIAVTVILLLAIDIKEMLNNRYILALSCVISLYLLQPYITLAADHIVYIPEPVNNLDQTVVAMTKPGDEIFMDAFVHDSIYLLYKERWPANRNCYILPWYMDWFEYDTIQDLNEKLPEIALFQPESEVYGQTGFCPDLEQNIKNLYEREGDSILWKLK